MYIINKGINRPPEVGDIRGMNYLMALGIAAVVGLLVSTILMFMGMPALYAYSGYLILLVIFYFFLAAFSKKNGENGIARYRARNSYPQVIRVRNSSPFRDMIKPKEKGK